jgi:Holliday junction resolvasome RuvABC endonuclease subunit
MLPIPEDTNTKVCVMGIDPGTETLGTAFIYFDLVTFDILSIEAATYKGSRLYGNSWIGHVHGDLDQRLCNHKANLINLLNQHMPISVAVESPFYNPKMPAAFAALIKAFVMIKEAIFEYDNWRTIIPVSPSIVKNAINAHGHAGKDPVKIALLAIEELMVHLYKIIDTLDEHSIDAIAVAYYLYLLYKNSQPRYPT